MIVREQVNALEEQLNDFSPEVRVEALGKLLRLVGEGQVPNLPEQPLFNLHAHSFYSFNALGKSPTALAWLAKQRGFSMIGMVDFDILDGLDEFFTACDLLTVRGVAGMETRVFIPEFASMEINSPGEPGISYTMGTGFTSSIVPGDVKPILDALRIFARLRIDEMLAKINDYLFPIFIDRELDLLPLSPSGNLTERHLVKAIINVVQKSAADSVAYWQQKMGLNETEVAQLADPISLQNLLRSKLLKRGGVGYIQPAVETYPTLEQVNQLIVACCGIPCVAWLDGTSAGEEDIAKLLSFLVEKGAGVINIVPDRNWNIKDPITKQKKLHKLYEVVDIAGQMDLPILVGTELNSFGQKLVDDLNEPELQPLYMAFQEGAHFIYGHTIMQRGLDLGFQSAWAKAHFPGRSQLNAFYCQVGKLARPGMQGMVELASSGGDLEPDYILKTLVINKIY